MRKPVWACLFLALVIGLLTSCAWPLERQLAGVRLGDRALDLLDKPDYGEPDFIGPLGALGYVAPQQQAAQPAAGRSGPAGPTRGAAGGRGGGGRSGRSMGAGGARGGRGGRGMAAGGGRGGAGVSRTAAPGASQADVPGMYWYYRRPGGAIMVLSLTQTGEVWAITLTGNTPYPPGRTSRDIGLTSSYMQLISQYGYPDQIITGGTVLELTYVDHSVRFTLDNMRVREISIGAHIGRALQPAPEIAPEEGLPPAGLSVEELRGYL